ncbi:MAG: WG repeat-containing protein [Cytophagaceae bacterium]|jgi:hypothetical protein|nr:WG repeat-containing protein [Cytophagaceae bacterium]
MKKTILIISILLIRFCVWGQQGNSCPEDLFPYFDKEKRTWGFADIMGMPVIEPIFTKVSPYSANKSIVQKGDLCGVIDCKGNLIVPVVYQKIQPFRYDKAWVLKNNKWGLIDDKGRTALAAVYDEVRTIDHTELTWLKKDNLWGLYDESKLKWMCTAQYTTAQPMSSTCSLVEINGNYTVLNHVDCGQLIQGEMTRVKRITLKTVIFEQEEKWGAFSIEGKLILQPLYDTVYMAKDGILAVAKGGKMGLMHTNGQPLAPLEYDSIFPFSNLFFKVKKDTKYGYMNSFGKVQIPIHYTSASDFKHYMAVVEKNNKKVLINFKDSILSQTDDLYIQLIPDYPIALCKGKQGVQIVSSKGINTFVKSPYFKSVQIEGAGVPILICKKEDEGICFYNTQTGRTSSTFDALYPVRNNRTIYKKNGLYGVIEMTDPATLQYTTIIESIYDSIVQDQIGQLDIFKIKQNQFWKVVTQDGKELIATPYSNISVSGIYFIAQNSSGWWVLKYRGQALHNEPLTVIDTTVIGPDWIVQRSNLWYIMNEKGTVSKGIKAQKIKVLDIDRYAALYGKKTTIVNEAGIPLKVVVLNVRPYQEGLAAVQQKKGWGFIDKNGVVVIPCTYLWVSDIQHGMAVVQLPSGYQIINKKGNLVNDTLYESMQIIDNKLYVVKNSIQYEIDSTGIKQKK